MIKRLDNIRLAVGRAESDLIKIASRRLGAPVRYFKILKKSLDARDKSNIFWQYSLAVSSAEERDETPAPERTDSPLKVVIVGSGPAGLMCALRLLDHGIRPVIVERGRPVEERRESCLAFFNGRVLDEESNVQFGEGGAGAFSDGKLNTQTHDGFNRDVLKYFAAFGAPGEILYLNKPHIGSDNLYNVLRAMRKHIIEHGGRVLFDSRVDGILCKESKVVSLNVTNVRSGATAELGCDIAVFAVGHSARDTFKMLAAHSVAMEPREFAVGVRIEHLASYIGRAQYGEKFSALPAADYKLVSHAHERTVFTFCMCPGGVVIPAASSRGGVVVNGMSLYARDGVNSNSALMVQMRRSDFGSDDLFAGMRFQEDIERRAFEAGGWTYRAPAITFGDFAAGRCSGTFGEVKPSYAAGVVCAPLDGVLPDVAAEALKVAIPDMNRRLKGFSSPSAVLTGVETRFSSPVRIIRNSLYQSVTYDNLYPCGEGSGYSGGITSSAADGIRVAEAIFGRIK